MAGVKTRATREVGEFGGEAGQGDLLPARLAGLPGLPLVAAQLLAQQHQLQVYSAIAAREDVSEVEEERAHDVADQEGPGRTPLLVRASTEATVP
jgi:hypothetical protein